MQSGYSELLGLYPPTESNPDKLTAEQENALLNNLPF